MQRYFIDQTVEVHETYTMDTEHIHHIKNVMRARVDDIFTVVDNKGIAYIVQLTDAENITLTATKKDEIIAEIEAARAATNDDPSSNNDNDNADENN